MTRPQIPSREEVKTLCDRNGPFSKGLTYGDKIWIKYGYGVTLGEAAIQQFVHEKADHRIVYTPEVYDFFSILAKPGLQRMTYIVKRGSNGVCALWSVAESSQNKKGKARPDKTEGAKRCVIARG